METFSIGLNRLMELKPVVYIYSFRYKAVKTDL